MKSWLKNVSTAALCVLVLFCFTGCGSKAAVSEVYEDFRAKVNRGDLDGAWTMLDESSQQAFGGSDEFKRVVNSMKDSAFAPTSVIRGTTYVGGNENMSQGQIYLMDDSGKKTGEAGAFTAVREGSKWLVNWTLPRKTADSGEIPGGGAPGQ